MRVVILFQFAVLFIFGGSSWAEAQTGLISLDEALSSITAAVEAKVPQGYEIAITDLTASLPELSSFLIDELESRFSAQGKLKVLARGKILENPEGDLGHYLGAKVVITGTFDRFGSFSQLRIRAVDLREGYNLLTYSVRIRHNDPILAEIIQSLEQP